MIDDLQEYCNQRARIYEQVYRRDDPEITIGRCYWWVSCLVGEGR